MIFVGIDFIKLVLVCFFGRLIIRLHRSENIGDDQVI